MNFLALFVSTVVCFFPVLLFSHFAFPCCSLRGNRYGADGARALVAALQANTSLVLLYVLYRRSGVVMLTPVVAGCTAF